MKIIHKYKYLHVIKIKQKTFISYFENNKTKSKLKIFKIPKKEFNLSLTTIKAH